MHLTVVDKKINIKQLERYFYCLESTVMHFNSLLSYVVAGFGWKGRYRISNFLFNLDEHNKGYSVNTTEIGIIITDDSICTIDEELLGEKILIDKSYPLIKEFGCAVLPEGLSYEYDAIIPSSSSIMCNSQDFI